MIVEVEQETTSEVPHNDLMVEYPLNPALRTLWCALDLLEEQNHKALEYFSYGKIETLHLVVGVKSIGLEKW